MRRLVVCLLGLMATSCAFGQSTWTFGQDFSPPGVPPCYRVAVVGDVFNYNVTAEASAGKGKMIYYSGFGRVEFVETIGKPIVDTPSAVFTTWLRTADTEEYAVAQGFYVNTPLGLGRIGCFIPLGEEIPKDFSIVFPTVGFERKYGKVITTTEHIYAVEPGDAVTVPAGTFAKTIDITRKFRMTITKGHTPTMIFKDTFVPKIGYDAVIEISDPGQWKQRWELTSYTLSPSPTDGYNIE